LRSEVEGARALADRVLARDVRAAARLMRLLDDRAAIGLAAYGIVHREGGEAPVIGVTGAPGAGKSSLIDQLIAALRADGKRVGVVAVDPSSPVTGGAVLADRVRMQRHALDEGVFVRSLASRGHRGGLSASASATARVLETISDFVLLETVGIGQTEVDVAGVADTVIVVLAPGMGDDVQAMKAGLLEVPDILVVNKADREGAELVVRDLELMLHLGIKEPTAWTPPVLKTVATRGEGIGEVIDAIGRHYAHPARVSRRESRARLDLESMLLETLRARLLEKVGGEQALVEAAKRIAGRASDPMRELELLLGE
jgi:LAO/AO transport system kinase